tara:strand:- start:199 stop:813 length:615 start_codon:yes stop_codon:yes gene_type:complete
MELHLIRHGQTNWNEERRAQGQSESKLTKKGKEQALALKEKISHITFDQIFCSSSLRTRQTAELIFPNQALNIEYLDSLKEIFLGSWEGRLYKDIEVANPESHNHFWEEPHLFDLRGAETFYQLQERAVSTVQKIAKNSTSKKVVIVSHGALIKSLLCDAERKPIKELWSPPRMHNCAHSIIVYKKETPQKILQYADVPYKQLG